MSLTDLARWFAVALFAALFGVLLLQLTSPYPRTMYRVLCFFGWHFLTRRDVTPRPEEDAAYVGVDACECDKHRRTWLTDFR